MAVAALSPEIRETNYPGENIAHTSSMTSRLIGRKWISSLAVALAFSAPSPALASSELPEQGVFDACFPTLMIDTCEARAEKVAEAGFEVMLNSYALSQSTDMPTLLQYAETTHSDGLKNIWMLDPGWLQDYNPDATNMFSAYPVLAAESNASTNDELLDYILLSLSNPDAGTLGYYFDDTSFPNGKASPEYIAALRKLTNHIHRIDPKAKTMVATYGSNKQPLVKLGEAVDMVLPEDYPVGLPSNPHPDNSKRSLQKIRRHTRNVARPMCFAQRHDTTMGAILQGWSWGDSEVDASNLYGPARGQKIFTSQSLAYPTAEQNQVVRDTTIEVGRPKLILWFLLNDTIGWPNGEAPDGWRNPTPLEATRRWNSLTKAAFAPLPQDISEGSKSAC